MGEKKSIKDTYEREDRSYRSSRSKYKEKDKKYKSSRRKSYRSRSRSRSRSESRSSYKRRKRYHSSSSHRHPSSSDKYSHTKSRHRSSRTYQSRSTSSSSINSLNSSTSSIGKSDKDIKNENITVMETNMNISESTDTSMIEKMDVESMETSVQEEHKPHESVCGPPNSSVLPINNLDVTAMKENLLKALTEARKSIKVLKKEESPGLDTENQDIHEKNKLDLEPKDKQLTNDEIQKTETSNDFDMFAEDAMDEILSQDISNVEQHNTKLQCDDAEGYYRPTIGELLDKRYKVLGEVGKGVFSSVLRCQDISIDMNQVHSIVAIKLIRNNDVMRDAAALEMRLLRSLQAAGSSKMKYIVQLLRTFEHRDHIALVFEPMAMNVREALRKFGAGRQGISLSAVQVFAKHTLTALCHLQSQSIVHGDLKLDNLLLDASTKFLKVCDFGSAFLDRGVDGQQPVELTPYLVSRFYRAPEIILGLEYSYPIDMWSAGCCFYEMFTSNVMFPGANNNEMLKLMMELKGKFPSKIVKKHRVHYMEKLEKEPHFNPQLHFISHEMDVVTNTPISRIMEVSIVPKNPNILLTKLLTAKSPTDDRKVIGQLRDLLEKCFCLDPMKRITPQEALKHPFITGK